MLDLVLFIFVSHCLLLVFLRVVCHCRLTVPSIMQSVPTQARHYYTAGDPQDDESLSLSLAYLTETYPAAVSIFAFALYVCVVWLQGYYL